VEQVPETQGGNADLEKAGKMVACPGAHAEGNNNEAGVVSMRNAARAAFGGVKAGNTPTHVGNTW
jgi:hypothetical protein